MMVKVACSKYNLPPGPAREQSGAIIDQIISGRRDVCINGLVLWFPNKILSTLFSFFLQWRERKVQFGAHFPATH